MSLAWLGSVKEVHLTTSLAAVVSSLLALQPADSWFTRLATKLSPTFDAVRDFCMGNLFSSRMMSGLSHMGGRLLLSLEIEDVNSFLFTFLSGEDDLFSLLLLVKAEGSTSCMNVLDTVGVYRILTVVLVGDLMSSNVETEVGVVLWGTFTLTFCLSRVIISSSFLSSSDLRDSVLYLERK